MPPPTSSCSKPANIELPCRVQHSKQGTAGRCDLLSEPRAAAASSSNRQPARRSGTQQACRCNRHQRAASRPAAHPPHAPASQQKNWDQLCARERQLFTRANIYAADRGDVAVPMLPASGSCVLRAPRLAAVTRRAGTCVVESVVAIRRILSPLQGL